MAIMKMHKYDKEVHVQKANTSKTGGVLKGAFHEIIRKHNILKSNKIITTCINNKLYIS